MSINTKKKSHGFHLPLLLCLLLAFATFPVYSQQDLKTIRKDNKADKERLEKFADKNAQEIKQEEELLKQQAVDSNKKIIERLEEGVYNESILNFIGFPLFKWQEKGEFEKTEDWNLRLKKKSSELFAYYCNKRLSAIIKNPYIIRLSEYNPDEEAFSIDISFGFNAYLENYYYYDARFPMKWGLASSTLDTILYLFDYSYKLNIPISKAKGFKSKMLNPHASFSNHNFFGGCFYTPFEPSNFRFYHHYPIPMHIIFYNYEIDSLKVLSELRWKNDYNSYYSSLNEYPHWSDAPYYSQYGYNYGIELQENQLHYIAIEDSIKRLNPWGAPKYVINVLENIDTNEIEDIIIYFDDLGIENPYLKGSYYNYTKQKFYQNPETAKLIAEEEARLQKIKAEQEQKRINDSIFQQADSILQSAIEDYHRYLKQLPYDTIENRIALSLPDSLNGKNQKLSETLNWLLDTVKSKKAEIATRYTNDSIIFSKYNDKLHKLT